MKILNPAAEFMPRSGIRYILDKANNYSDVLHLEIGQPDLPTPPHIVDAAMRAAREGFTGYTPNAGYPSLRRTFAKRLSAEQGINIYPEQIVVTVGAMGGLFSAMSATLAPGDEALVPDPGYPNYSMALRLLGGKTVSYPLKKTSRFALDTEEIRTRITPQTKLIVINSPSNPTGAVISEVDLINVVEIAKTHGLYLLSDEAYDHVIFDGKHISPLKYDDAGCAISIYSCSKTYSMTGWRVGFTVSTAENATIITKLQEAFVACAASISQKAAEAALTGPQQCVDDMRETYSNRRNLALDLCSMLGLQCIAPSGAFYLMIELPSTEKRDSLEFCLQLIKDKRVAIAPGVTFGKKGEGFIRASLCASEEVLKTGLSRLAEYLHNS
ncbi:MAG: aminotransferase class I/II-fold pyridoxal phosphate-dependent enzyme [bacterium]|nr:aminotransferase class I/II-fold pyridoxal phosphate-dependent enzyme [bacterium]